MSLDRFIIRVNPSVSPTSNTNTNTRNRSAGDADDDENYNNAKQQEDDDRNKENKQVDVNYDTDESEEFYTDSNECTNKRRKLTRKKFTQAFREVWVTEENKDWLSSKPDTGHAFCKACNKIIIGGITHINRHANSARHLVKLEAVSSSTKISNFVTTNPDESRKLKRGIQEGEIKMILFLAEHDLPFRLLDLLPKFLASVCYDSDIAKNLRCGRKKGTQICTQLTGPENLRNVSQNIRNSWFSLIVDETTDISTKKCLAVLARHYNTVNKNVQDRYLGLVEVENATAEALFSSIKKLLSDNDIPLTKIIGFAADNASVMQGNKNSVQAKLKNEIPNIFILGCVCHSLALCSTAACKKLPTSVEQLARDIVNYFAHSSKRQTELKEYQHFVQISEHKLLKLSGTRWFSLQAVVDRILEQWQALILFFTNETYDKNNMTVNPSVLLEALKNPIFKLYFSFLSYVLDIVNKMNIEFQSESPKLYMLYSRISSLYKSILKNFMRKEYLSNVQNYNRIQFIPENYMNVEGIYCGANCEAIALKENIEANELNNFRIKCLSFYVELSKQVSNRFDFDDFTLKFLSNFEPTIAVSGSCESLVPIAVRFPKLVGNNIEKLNSEWRLLPDTPDIKQFISKPFIEFWATIFDIKNGLDAEMFPHLTEFVKGILCLPHSSAAAERVFSSLAILKTKNRNKLNISTCNSLLYTKFLLDGKKCYEFQPSNSLMKRNLNESRDNRAREVTDMAMCTDEVELTF